MQQQQDKALIPNSEKENLAKNEGKILQKERIPDGLEMQHDEIYLDIRWLNYFPVFSKDTRISAYNLG